MARNRKLEAPIGDAARDKAKELLASVEPEVLCALLDLSSNATKQVNFRLSETAIELLKHHAAMKDTTVQNILQSLVNLYITGKTVL